MNQTISVGFLQLSALLYGGLGIALVFIIMMIPSLMVPGAKPEKVAKAITCYLLKTIGIILLAGSAVQLIYAGMTNNFPGFPAMSALLLILVLGIGMLTHMSVILKANIDDASEMVPRLVFFHSLEVLGIVISLVAALSIVISFMMASGQISGWEMQATMLLLGIILTLTAAVSVNDKNAKIAKRKKK
jgi:hypothetical protein